MYNSAQKEEVVPVEVVEGDIREEEKEEEGEVAVPAKKFRLKRGTAKEKPNLETDSKPSKPDTKPEAKLNDKPEDKPKINQGTKPVKKPVTKPKSNKLQAKPDDKPEIKPKARSSSRPEAKPENKPKKFSPLKRELPAGNSSDGGPAKKVSKNHPKEVDGNQEKNSGKRRGATVATPGTPPLPRISNREVTHPERDG